MDIDAVRARLHALELKIALEIKRICEQHRLRYFLIYGTLLGAVRHGGFIPWDDDMDIGMPRADYDAFAEVCRTALRPEFLYQSWDTDPSYPFPAAKLRLRGTHTREQFSIEGAEDGIYVDIFPFDAVPDGGFARRIQSATRFLGKRLLWMKKGYGRCIRDESPAKRAKYALAAGAVRFLPYPWLKRRMAESMVCHNGRPTRFVIAPGDYPAARERIERRWLGALEPVPFAGETFPAFAERDAYLRHLYGDYMALPPESARRGHAFLHVDFGPYGGESGEAPAFEA